MQAPSKRLSADAETIRSNWSQLFLQHLLVPVILLVVIIFLFPPRANFEFSADEGLNLMKAMLVERGYPLYQSIWSDQPPLFTYLLVPVIRVFGNNVQAARFLVLFLSCILLWASFQVMQLIWGGGAAWSGTFLIFLLPYFLILSVSVMIGLPAIALAMLSLLALLQWHARRGRGWLVLSAALLALSVLVKLITGFLAIIFLAGLLAAQYREFRRTQEWKKFLFPAFTWIAVFAGLVVAGVLVFVGPSNLDQLITTHLLAEQVTSFRTEPWMTLGFHVRTVSPLFVLTIVGIVYSIQSRRWLALYLAAWFAASLLLLSVHRPVWEHQTLLLTIPAAMLAGPALFEVVRRLSRAVWPEGRLERNSMLFLAALVGSVALLFTFRPNESLKMIGVSPKTFGTEPEMPPNPARVYRRMERYAPQSSWVVTDMPMYAFRTGVPVPPELAVFSAKRVETGDLTEADILAAVREYRPEQIMFGRFRFPGLRRELLEEYDLIYEDSDMQLYLRRVQNPY
jgi:4-amino-4-deoxy-L-arabinose transferase-like glycosyltransferase